MSTKRRVLLLVLINPKGPLGANVAYAFSSDRVAFDVSGLGLPGAVLPFRVRISGQDDIVIERQASVWPFGRAPTQRAGVVSLLNGDRALDACLSGSYKIDRDWRYQLRWCWDDEAADPNHDIATTTLWQAGVIDSVSTTEGDRRIVLTLADPLAEYDVPLQPVMYPDDFPNPAAAGKPKPITLGTARFVGGTLRRSTGLIVSPGPPAVLHPDAYSFDLHDGPISEVTAAYDRGDLFTAVTDYNYLPSRTGIKLVNKPDNPVTAHVIGQVVNDGASTTWNFKTGAWAGGAPSGWTKLESGGATLTQVAGGARFYCPVGGVLQLTTAGGVLTTPKLWRVTVVVGGFVNDQVRVMVVGGLPPVPEPQPPIQSQATYEWITPLLGANRWLRFFAGGVNTDLTIEKVTIEPVKLTTRLPEFVRAVVERVRAGTWSDAVDTAAVTALDTAAPYALGMYADQPVTALTVLRRALDGWCGWVTATRAGKLTVGRLARYVSGDTVKLGRANIITVRRSADTAPGLAARLAGLRTHKVHSDGDIAGSVDSAVRAELQAEYTIKTGSTALPTAYAHAVGADPRPTLLQDATQLQAAADYAADIFGQGPLTWYEVECAISPEIADGLEMGDWIHITYPVAGLDAGKWLCLMGATLRFRSRRATLTLLEIP